MESSKESVAHYARGLFLASFAAFIFTSMMTSAAVGGPLIDEHLSASVGNVKLAAAAPVELKSDECDDYRSVNCNREIGGGGVGGGWRIPAGASASLTVTPEVIEPGQMVTVSWETNKIKSCIVTEDGKEISKYTDYTNLKRGPLSAETVYSLTCLGEDKNTKIDKTVTVKVDAATGAPTVTITADPTVVDYNGTAKIAWQSVGADTCSISKNGVSVGTGNAYEAKNLLADTIFKVKCSNKKGSVADTIEVAVRPPQSPTLSFSAEPAAIAYNGSTKLSWSTEHANSCTIKQGRITIANGLRGEKEIVGLKSDTQYIMNCVGMAGTKAEQTVQVTVAKPEAPTATIAAEPTTVAYEGSAKIVWSSTDADSCSVTSTGVRRTGTKGEYKTLALTKDTVYAISCTGPGGTVKNEITITVTPPVRPTVTLNVSKNEIVPNEVVTYSWKSEHAKTCLVYQGNGQIATGVSGENNLIRNLRNSTVVWVTCTGAGGSVSTAQPIQVQPGTTSVSNGGSSNIGGGSNTIGANRGTGDIRNAFTDPVRPQIDMR